jgi:TonB family protein
MLLVAVVTLWLLAGSLHAQDRHPVQEATANPQYPYEMSRAGIGGRVKVEFVIGASGGVIEAGILQSTHREFEKPALAAVMKWKFKPGMKGGRPVNVRASQVIEFNLDASPVYPFELLTGKIEPSGIWESSQGRSNGQHPRPGLCRPTGRGDHATCAIPFPFGWKGRGANQ